MNVDTKFSKLSLFDTKFNCSEKCEKFDFGTKENFESDFYDNNENQVNLPKTDKYIPFSNKKTVMNNEKTDIKNKYTEMAAGPSKSSQPLPTTIKLPKPAENKIIQKENQSHINNIVNMSASHKISQNQFFKDNTSVINLPNSQMDSSSRIYLVVIPIFVLCSLFIYRFRTLKFRRMSHRIFSPKGRYQL